MTKNKILIGLLAVLTMMALLLIGCATTTAPTVSYTPNPFTTQTTPTPTPMPTSVPTPMPISVPTPTPTTSLTTSPPPAIKFEGKYIDVHTHIMTSKMPLNQIIQNMDSQGIDKIIIMETPTVIYNGLPQGDYGIPDAAEKYPDRFIALYAGDAITMLDQFASKTYTKTDEDKYIALLENAMKTEKYAGFGEVALRHGPAPSQSSDAEVFADITVPGDHPWMLILSDIAAKYDVPIDIHMEATDETIPGLEKLLDHNTNTKIIWSHAGWEQIMNGKATPGLLRQLMEKHPNLYSSITIRDGSTQAVSFLDKQGLITSEWMALLKDYPDRFMMGSDIKPGLRQNEFAYVAAESAILKQLPPDILEKIARENAIELFKIK